MAARGKSASASAPAPDAVRALCVCTVDAYPKFRRCGRLFTIAPVEIPIAELSDDEVTRILATPALIAERI